MSVASISNTPSSEHSQSPTRFIACSLLAMIGIGILIWEYQDSGLNSPPLRWLVPGTPFVLLAGLSLVSRIPLRVTIGAYIGGLLTVSALYYVIWSSTLNYNGGGANIGLGLLEIAVYVLLPIPMLIGGFLGWLVPTRPQLHANSKESS